jgi:hypothetical protein
MDETLLRCCRCHELKPLSAFHHSSQAGRQRQRGSYCKPCRLAYRRAWNARRYEQNRDADLRARYGIGMAEYRALYDAQGGVCAICGGAETLRSTLGKDLTLAVDHDHETGAVRALLCRRCNQGLGMFRHSPALLQTAIAYLGGAQVGSVSGIREHRS